MPGRETWASGALPAPGRDILTFLSLERPGRLGPHAWVILGIVAVAYAALVVTARMNIDTIWPASQTLATAHAVSMSILLLTGSAIFWWHALSNRFHGYLVLAAGFLFVGVLVGVFPFYFPNGISQTEPPTSVFGGPQAGPWLWSFWNYGLLATLVAGAVATRPGEQGVSRRSRRFHPVLTLIGTGLGVAVAISLVTVQPTPLPALLDGPAVTPLFARILDLFIVLSVAATVVVLLIARKGSAISAWLAALTVLNLGAALLTGGDRYSAVWYANRAFSLIGLAILIMFLIREVGRIGRQAHMIASRDLLTGLLSRARFMDLLRERVDDNVESLHSGHLLLVDLDYFGSLNDRVGADAGDEVLRTVATRIEAALPTGTPVARMASDEFAIDLNEPNPDRARFLVNEILRECRRPIELDETFLFLTASVGSARYPEDAQTSSDLIGDAGMALKTAKRSGGDRLAPFSAGMREDAERVTLFRQEFAAALGEVGAFDLDYQPIVEPRHGEVVGVEALVRWNRDGRRLTAGSFVPAATDAGLIVRLGRLIIRRLENDLDTLTRIQPDLEIHFNLTISELSDQVITEYIVSGPLADPRHQVVVEATESEALYLNQHAHESIAMLRASGIGLAIDDFGIGYSSLERLDQLKPDIIKFDRSLITRAGSDSRHGATFLDAAVAITRSLGCRSVAEGVETVEEDRAVRSRQIDRIQGYRYGKPMPLTDFAVWMRERAEAMESDSGGSQIPPQSGSERASRMWLPGTSSD